MGLEKIRIYKKKHPINRRVKVRAKIRRRRIKQIINSYRKFKKAARKPDLGIN
jgi:hypothetical protein